MGELIWQISHYITIALWMGATIIFYIHEWFRPRWFSYLWSNLVEHARRKRFQLGHFRKTNCDWEPREAIERQIWLKGHQEREIARDVVTGPHLRMRLSNLRREVSKLRWILAHAPLLATIDERTIWFKNNIL